MHVFYIKNIFTRIVAIFVYVHVWQILYMVVRKSCHIDCQYPCHSGYFLNKEEIIKRCGGCLNDDGRPHMGAQCYPGVFDSQDQKKPEVVDAVAGPVTGPDLMCNALRHVKRMSNII